MKSLLDRFLDTSETFDYRASVFRDLLWLLNTRRCRSNEKVLTVLDYGFPDVADVKNITEELARTIAAFEPRLKEVSIRTVDLSQTKDASAPFFGVRSSVDAAGRNIATKRFRLGVVLDAKLNDEYITFAFVQDDEGGFHVT